MINDPELRAMALDELRALLRPNEFTGCELRPMPTREVRADAILKGDTLIDDAGVWEVEADATTYNTVATLRLRQDHTHRVIEVPGHHRLTIADERPLADDSASDYDAYSE